MVSLSGPKAFLGFPATRNAERVETLVDHIVAVIDGRKQNHDTSSAQFRSSCIMHRDCAVVRRVCCQGNSALLDRAIRIMVRLIHLWLEIHAPNGSSIGIS